MRMLVKYFEEEEQRSKAFYENRLSELTSELARYQKSICDTEAADPESPQQQAKLREKMKWVMKKKSSEEKNLINMTFPVNYPLPVITRSMCRWICVMRAK